MASIEVKRISSSCNTVTHACVFPFQFTKITPITVCVYTLSARSVLHVCMKRKRAAYAYRINLSLRQHSASVGLVQCTRTHELFRWSKGTVARDFCIKLRLWGVRLGPTDVTHPLLTSVHCPFNLLRSFKEGAHRSKTDFIILSETHALHVRV